MGATMNDLGNNTSEMAPLMQEGYKGQTATQNMSQTSGIKLSEASGLEKQATGDIGSQYDFLKNLLSRGPGAEAVDASNNSQNDFVSMLKGINANGGMPTTEDTRRANSFADQLFAPQQEALNQSFTQQNQDAARLAAQLNRPINDPIIQAKLKQEQMRQSSMLNADRSGFVAQEARNSPFQRLQMQGQLADAQGSLASQAMSNRMQLLNLGNSLQSQERNWRLQTGERYGTASGSQHSGGGLSGAFGNMNSVVGSFGGAIGAMGGGFMGQSSTGAGATSGSAQPTQQNAATAPGGYASQGGYQSQYFGTLGGNGNNAYAPSNSRTSRLTSNSSSGGSSNGSFLTGMWGGK